MQMTGRQSPITKLELSQYVFVSRLYKKSLLSMTIVLYNSQSGQYDYIVVMIMQHS